jgi:hypothetical protein
MGFKAQIAWLAGLVLWLGGAAPALAQIYGYTNEKGVLILSNIPTDKRMNLIAAGTPDEAGRVWRYNGQYDALIMRAARESGVDHALVKAVIAVESAFNRFARSHKGAQGLMQLMPDTARRYGVVNPYDPWQNISGGTRHLRELMDEFDDLRLSLAAYNAGATPVRRMNRVPPYRETQDYVKKVLAVYRAGSRVSITMAGRTHSIGAPGATIQVTRTAAAAQVASANESGAPLPTAAQASSSSGPASVAEDVALAVLPQPGVAPVTGPLYYRYRDELGVIYISRTKPSDVEYEVLEP